VAGDMIFSQWGYVRSARIYRAPGKGNFYY